MFQTAIGRINSHIIAPPRSLDLKIFIDAGGKSGQSRVWGGLATIGNTEISWIEKTLNNLSERNKNSISANGELKGRDIPTAEIKVTGQQLIKEDRRILFWSNFLPEWESEHAQKLISKLEKTLVSFQPNSLNINQIKIERRYKNNSDYFKNIKPVNKYKVLSIITHLQWIISAIKTAGIGQQLKSVTIDIDRENFQDEELCAELIKTFIAAGFQGSGMDNSLTGKAFREKPNEGAIIVNVSGESETNVGIRYTDILLQVVLRKVLPLP